MKALYQELPVAWLERGRYQPRRHFDEHSLQELAESLLTQGLIEPLIVRELATERYEIIAGERRWRAAILAKLETVPCLIGNYNDEQAATLTLVENIQRQELNVIEEAIGYRRLREEFHFQQDEIAALVSKSRSHIANLLRLLTLNHSVQQQLIEEKLSLGHARLLVGMPVEQQMALASQTIQNNWSVRFLEDKVKSLKTVLAPVPPHYPDRDIERLANHLAEQVGAPVQITCEKGQSGWLQIKFFDNDTLAGLLERMGLRYD